MSDRAEALRACLLGAAVGDALGLPFEGLSPRRIARWWRQPLAHRFLFGRGFVSDDTDHAVFVAQALLRSQGEVGTFRRALAWRLRLWLSTLPAGIGFATLRSLLKLWLGWPPASSGVHSAGNGPCMRAPLIGVQYARDADRRREFVDASTLITHRDPRALIAARALADLAAALARSEWTSRPAPADLLALLSAAGDHPDWCAALAMIGDCLNAPDPLDAARAAFGTPSGISGYALHTLPFALVAWWQHHGAYVQTLESVIRAGGDTDSVGAVAGALAALSAGAGGIPSQWVDRIIDWPHSPALLDALASALADPTQAAPTGFRAGLWLRSPLFLAAVLAHGLRRSLPPW